MSLLNDASLVLIPSGYKEDKVYSIIPSDGSGDLDFVRGSEGTRINSLGQVENVCWNLATYSEDFANGAWNKFVTITSNTIVSPVGTLTADKINENSGNDYQNAFQAVSTIQGVYTFSLYLKKGQNDRCVMFAGSPQALLWIDMTTWTVFSQTNINSYSIDAVGSGWYRVSFSFTNTSTSSPQYGINLIQIGTSNTVSYAGNTSNGLYVWGAQVNVGALKPYFPTTDRLNVPRLTYENGCPSLLLEKQSTNVNTWSEDLTNAAWNKYYASINSNAITSPDGTQNADKVVESPLPVTAFHYVESTNYISNGATYTVSCFLKKAEREFGYIGVYTTQSSQIRVNLTTGTIVGTVGTWIDTKIENFGNGWYRVIGTFTASSTTYFFTGPALDATTLTYIGDGTSGIHVWGAQIEQSSYPTSYIPTTSTSVTRLADSCYKTGISSLIGQTEGTLFVDINPKDFQAASYIGISDGSATNRIILGFESSGNANSGILYTFGLVSFPNTFTANRDQRLKIAIAYKSGDNAFYINGNLIASNNNTFSGIFNQGGFNWDIPGQPFKGNANQFILWKRRLTNTELTQLTTL
jgi:hypothetical protein